MADKIEFYKERHHLDETYAGGHYPIHRLLDLKAFRAWVAARKNTDGHSMLDVGCGKGIFSLECIMAFEKHSLRFGRSEGVDLQHAPGDVFSRIPCKFNFQTCDVDGGRLPFEDAQFDFVACNHVLEHVFSTENLVREMHRVMKPGSIGVISVPNLCAWVNRITVLLGGQPLGVDIGSEATWYGYWPKQGQSHLRNFSPSGHIRAFSPRGLKDLAESCGFKSVGWWNQDAMRLMRVTKWSGRGVGILLVKEA